MHFSTPLCAALALLALLTSSAQALEINTIPALGRHHAAVVIEKSLNRHNILVAYTKVDDRCRLLTSPRNRDLPIFDFYWLNNRTSFEALDSSIGTMIRGKLQVQHASRESISLALTDFKNLRHDIADPRLVVRARMNSRRHCEVASFLTLGPSNHNAPLRVDSLYLEMGMMGGVNAITITGKHMLTGRMISRRYDSAW